MSRPTSVVIAVARGSAPLEACLAAHLSELKPGDEILVVAAEPPPVSPSIAHPAVTVLSADSDRLVPHLWGQGLEAAAHDVVRVTIPSFIPASGWRVAAEQALREGAAGVSGPLSLDQAASCSDSATYVLRYRNYAPSHIPLGNRPDIPADHATYRRSTLLSATPSLKDGFWERPVNAELVRLGHQLCLASNYAATFVGGESPRAFLSQRFHHGREFGASLVRDHPLMRILRSLAFLLPMLVFWIRITRECLRSKSLRRAYRRGFPWLLAFLFAWSFGEWVGVVFGHRSSSSRLH